MKQNITSAMKQNVTSAMKQNITLLNMDQEPHSQSLIFSPQSSHSPAAAYSWFSISAIWEVQYLKAIASRMVKIEDSPKKGDTSSSWKLFTKSLHGEIKVLKFQILFCKYLCTSYLGEIFDSSTRPFFYFGRLFILSSTNIKWKGNLSEIFGCR